MRIAAEIATDARIPIASCCEICPAALLCDVAEELQHQVTDCGLPLHDDLVHALRVNLDARITQFARTAQQAA